MATKKGKGNKKKPAVKVATAPVVQTQELSPVALTPTSPESELNKFDLKTIEEIIEWTFPSLTYFYRDTNIPRKHIRKYQVGEIIRSQIFTDVTSIASGLSQNVRFLIASAHAAPLFLHNPDVAKWQLFCINYNSYFKILDVHKIGEKTQVFLIHIPSGGVPFFSQKNDPYEALLKDLVVKARENFEQKLKLPPLPILQEKGWIGRTEIPLGLDNYNDLFSLTPSELPSDKIAQSLFSAIKIMSKDSTSTINVPQTTKPVSQSRLQQKKSIESSPQTPTTPKPKPLKNSNPNTATLNKEEEDTDVKNKQSTPQNELQTPVESLQPQGSAEMKANETTNTSSPLDRHCEHKQFLERVISLDPLSNEFEALFQEEEEGYDPEFKAMVDKEVQEWQKKLEQIYDTKTL